MVYKSRLAVQMEVSALRAMIISSSLVQETLDENPHKH